MNITKLLIKGQQTLNAERAKGDEDKRGILRGGSAGAIIDGQVYGNCARIHYLRTKGVEIKPDLNTQVMFDSGIANEDSVFKVLSAALPKGYKLLREEEIPVTWDTNDFKATGRPDMVYVDENDKPVLGLELKSISSIYTARNIIANKKPSSSHLIQAGFYSYRLGAQNSIDPIPYKLIYSSSPYWHLSTIGKTVADEFAGSKDVEMKNNRPFRVLPTRKVFDLSWQSGVLHYKPEHADEWKATLLTIESINLYYNTVALMGKTKTLPPLPTDLNLVGNKEYSPCQYCELAKVCNKTREFDKWYDEVVMAVNSINSEKD